MFNNSKHDSHKGYLYKWTNYVKGYQKRWFVLSNGYLSYYRNQQEVNHACRGTINLATSNIRVQDLTTIVISNASNQTFHLKALSENETCQWVTSLHLAKETAAKSLPEDGADFNNTSCVPNTSPVYSQLIDAMSIKSEQYQSVPDISQTQKEFDQRLFDLSTSVNLVTRNSEQLLATLKDFNQINFTPLTSNYSINAELCSSFDLKASDSLSLNSDQLSLVSNDPRPPSLLINAQISDSIQNIRDKNKGFYVSVQACVNLCNEFVSRAPLINAQYQKMLTNEREHRLRLENMVEELAKQLGALEKKAARKFESDSVANTNSVSIVSSKDDNKGSKLNQGEPSSDESEDEPFFDAVEDERIFNVSLPRPITSNNTDLLPQHTMHEYESCDSDTEFENDNPKSNTMARVIVRSVESKKKSKKSKKTKKNGERKHAPISINDISQSHRRTASAGFSLNGIKSSETTNRSMRVTSTKYNSTLEVPNVMSTSQDDSATTNKLISNVNSTVELKSAKSVPSLLPQSDKKTPKVRRKKIMPRPNLSVSLWGIMKNCIGKELSKIPVPVNFNEPLSMIQRLTEDFEYSECLDAAAVCKDSIEQMARVAAFTVSSYSTTTNRTGKPFNPLLGETFECDRTDDKGWRSLAEQVSHHPPAAALHCQSDKGWNCWQEFTMSSKFRGKYLAIIPLGIAHLKFTESNNHFTWRKVTSTVHNIIVGKLWIDNHGEMEIFNHTTGDTCHLTYKAYSYFSREPARRVTGIIKDANGDTKYVLNGTWDDHFEGAKVVEIRKDKNNQQIFETGPTETLWQRVYPPEYTSEMYNFTEFALSLNEPEEGVAPTDSRLRPDQRLMEDGLWDEANKRKEQLEEKQREKRRSAEKVNEQRRKDGLELLEHRPTWFTHENDSVTDSMIYVYNDQYWTKRATGLWGPDLPDIF